jgi:integrase
VAFELRTVPKSAPNRSSELEKHRWRNIKSCAQFLDVGFVEVTLLMQDFGYDAFRAKDWNHIFLTQIIRIHQTGLRIAEALGLEIGKHLSDGCSVVVRQQRSKKGRGIEPFPKTDAGFRDVELDPALALLLKNYVDGRQTGPLFGTSSCLPLSARNIMRDSLPPILKAMGRGSAGFHIFRRFRNPSCK